LQFFYLADPTIPNSNSVIEPKDKKTAVIGVISVSFLTTEQLNAL